MFLRSAYFFGARCDWVECISTHFKGSQGGVDDTGCQLFYASAYYDISCMWHDAIFCTSFCDAIAIAIALSFGFHSVAATIRWVHTETCYGCGPALNPATEDCD